MAPRRATTAITGTAEMTEAQRAAALNSDALALPMQEPIAVAFWGSVGAASARMLCAHADGSAPTAREAGAAQPTNYQHQNA